MDLFSPIVTAASNIGSSVLNYIGQRETNDKYLQGVRETNQTNLEQQRLANQANLAMMREQNEWSRSQWERENSYNSPVRQLARMRQAGINSIDGINNGNAASVQSATGNPHQAAQLQAAGQVPNALSAFNFGGTVSDVVNQIQAQQQIRANEMSLKQQGIDLQFHYKKRMLETAYQVAELENKRSLTDSEKMRLARLKQDLSYYESQYPKMLRQLDQEFEKGSATIDSLKASTAETLAATLRQNKLADAEVKRMSVQNLVDKINATSGYQLSKQQVDSLKSEKWLNLARYSTDLSAKEIELRWQNQLNSLDAEQRIMAMYTLAYQLKTQRQKADSPLGQAFRYVFGADPDAILSGASSAVGGFVGARWGRGM